MARIRIHHHPSWPDHRTTSLTGGRNYTFSTCTYLILGGKTLLLIVQMHPNCVSEEFRGENTIISFGTYNLGR